MSKKRARTYARNRTSVSRRGNFKFDEPDAVYILKLALVLVLSSFWVKVTSISADGVAFQGLPVGVMAAFLLARTFEKNQFNRRIWYLVIVIVGLVSYFLPAGIVL